MRIQTPDELTLPPSPHILEWRNPMRPPRATPLARIEIEPDEGAFDDVAARIVLERGNYETQEKHA